MTSLQDDDNFGLQGEITLMVNACLYLVDALDELTQEELTLIQGCIRTCIESERRCPHGDGTGKLLKVFFLNFYVNTARKIP